MKRKLYYAWESHLSEGRMVLLESAQKPDRRPGRVLVRVEAVKRKAKT